MLVNRLRNFLWLCDTNGNGERRETAFLNKVRPVTEERRLLNNSVLRSHFPCSSFSFPLRSYISGTEWSIANLFCSPTRNPIYFPCAALTVIYSISFVPFTICLQAMFSPNFYLPHFYLRSVSIETAHWSNNFRFSSSGVFKLDTCKLRRITFHLIFMRLLCRSIISGTGETISFKTAVISILTNN